MAGMDLVSLVGGMRNQFTPNDQGTNSGGNPEIVGIE